MNPISRSTEYAIRALTYLAQNQESGQYHLAREMAETLGMPAPFLGKILQPLVTRGLLESQRGRHGGFRLCLPPAEVTLLQIASSQEDLNSTLQCFLGQSECSDERACPMHDYWKVAAANFEDQMQTTTLADLRRVVEERPDSSYPCPSMIPCSHGSQPGTAEPSAKPETESAPQTAAGTEYRSPLS